MPVTTLNSLPTEILINISNVLDAASLVSFSQLNRRLRSLSQSSSSFWLETLLRERELVIPLEPPLHRDIRERDALELQRATTHAIRRERHLSSDSPFPRSVTRLKAVFPTEDFDHACASYLIHSTGEWIFTVSVSRVFRVYNLRTEVPAYELRDYEFRDKNDISGQWGSNLGYVFTIDEIEKGVVLMAFVAYRRPKDGDADDQDPSSWEPEVLVLRIQLDMETRSASAKELARCPFDFVPGMMVLSGPRLFVANQFNSYNAEEDEDTALRLFSWPELRYVLLPKMLPSVYLNAYPDYFLSLGIIDESTIALQILAYSPSRAIEEENDKYTPLSDSDHFLVTTIQLPCQSIPGLQFLPRDAMIHHEYNGPNINDIIIWICDKGPHLDGEIDSHAWSVFEITFDSTQVFQRRADRSIKEADSLDFTRERTSMESSSDDTITPGYLLSPSTPIRHHQPPPPPPLPSPLNKLDSSASSSSSSSSSPPLNVEIVHKRITNYPFFRLLRSLGKGFRVARLELDADFSGKTPSTIYPLLYDTKTCPALDGSTLSAWNPLHRSGVMVSLTSPISVYVEKQSHGEDPTAENSLYLFDGIEATGIFVFVLNEGDVCVLRYGHE